MYIKWGDATLNRFRVGVKQGGIILSPSLFDVYMDDLSKHYVVLGLMVLWEAYLLITYVTLMVINLILAYV